MAAQFRNRMLSLLFGVGKEHIRIASEQNLTEFRSDKLMTFYILK